MPGLESGQSDNHLGVFWDIENCKIPPAKSAKDFVKKVRDHIIRPYNYREYEFFCSCDTRQLQPAVCEELNSAGVTIAHVPSTSKNACDEKVKEEMNKFVDNHGSQCTILLITGDVNFAPVLRGFRDRVGIRIILMYTVNTPEEFVSCANWASFVFEDFCSDIPDRKPKSVENRPYAYARREQNEHVNYAIEVTNLPREERNAALKGKLYVLTQNWGGRVLFINDQRAKISFGSKQKMEAARRHLDGYVMNDTRITARIVTDVFRSARAQNSTTWRTDQARGNSAVESAVQYSNRPATSGNVDGPSRQGQSMFSKHIITITGVSESLHQEEAQSFMYQYLNDCVPNYVKVENGTVRLTFYNLRVYEKAQKKLEGFQMPTDLKINATSAPRKNSSDFARSSSRSESVAIVPNRATGSNSRAETSMEESLRSRLERERSYRRDRKTDECCVLL